MLKFLYVSYCLKNNTVFFDVVVLMLFLSLGLTDQKTFESIDTNRYPMKEVLLHELIKQPQAPAVSIHCGASEIDWYEVDLPVVILLARRI